MDARGWGFCHDHGGGLISPHLFERLPEARGVSGEGEKGELQILPGFLIQLRGVEDVNWAYTLRYVIPNVKPGVYTLVHDDTAAEGVDRIARTVLDLTKAVKGGTTIAFKDDPNKKPAEPEKAK